MSVEEEILKRKEQLLSIENAKRALEQKKENCQLTVDETMECARIFASQKKKK